MPTVVQTISTVNGAMNVFMGAMVCYLEWRLFRRGIRIKLWYALVGLAWSMFYVIYLLFPPISREMARIIFVRPLITLTLTVLATGAIYRYRTLR